MFRRKRARLELSPELRDASVLFRHTVTAVEDAKGRLASAAPSGRGAGVPLAEALAGFEQGLRETAAAMPSWRRPEVEEVWTACLGGLDEAGRRAQRFRMAADVPDGYEQLYGQLADLIEPLDSFGVALARFHELGL